MLSDINQIDDRHLQWLRSSLLSVRRRRVCEIGCWKGHSTSAFFDALSMGVVDEVHLVDPKPRVELLEKINDHPLKNWIHLHRCSSVNFLSNDTDFDFIFVDGDHSKANVVAELSLLLPAQIPLIAAHDTSSGDRFPNCFGPQHIKHMYQMEGYYVIEDSLFRVNERTERGLTFAAKTLELYGTVLDGYRKYC